MTSITRRSGTYGPRHDPYGWEELDMERNGRSATIHFSGLQSWLEINGEQTTEHEAAERLATIYDMVSDTSRPFATRQVLRRWYADELQLLTSGSRDLGMAALDLMLTKHLGYGLNDFQDAYERYEQRQYERDPYYGCEHSLSYYE